MNVPPPAFSPQHREQTSIANAQVFLDGFLLADRGQALLSQMKAGARPDPDDCSRGNEELTHLYIGDRTMCVKAASETIAASDNKLNGPLCGRSGRNVRVILCPAAGAPKAPIVYQAIACHYSCQRDQAGVLDANVVLLSSKPSDEWDSDFKRSYVANCTGDDPRGR